MHLDTPIHYILCCLSTPLTIKFEDILYQGKTHVLYSSWRAGISALSLYLMLKYLLDLLAQLDEGLERTFKGKTDHLSDSQYAEYSNLTEVRWA